MSARELTSLVLLASLAVVDGACSGGRAIREQQPEATPIPETASATETSTPVFLESAPLAGLTPTATPLRYSFPTAGAGPVSAWRPPPFPAPLAIRPGDHFYFQRPIPSGNVNWAHPLYRYGNTFFGSERPHSGVDLGAERGTPVLAAADGEVVWAGYGFYRGAPDPNDPYGLAVSIRHYFGYDGQELHTVYAHLSRIFVWVGQRVRAGEEIGTVGDTGHASGPHLHFEVRLGPNRYYTTRNPELWMVPPEGWGVLVGRMLDAAGVPLSEHQIVVRSLETGRRWEVWTYAAGLVHSDDEFRENFAISDLPAGPYQVSLEVNRRLYAAELYVYPGQTNYVLFRARRGFTIEPTPTPANLESPPY
ncbi:MAG: peptidoglycan DD-metalloendopeptidase family protein [Chloroflexota bacterium]